MRKAETQLRISALRVFPDTSQSPSLGARAMLARYEGPSGGPLGRGLASSAIGGHALIRDPDAVGFRAGLPEHINRNAAARIPISSDAQPLRIEEFMQATADGDGAILMKRTVIAERAKKQFQ